MYNGLSKLTQDWKFSSRQELTLTPKRDLCETVAGKCTVLTQTITQPLFCLENVAFKLPMPV